MRPIDSLRSRNGSGHGRWANNTKNAGESGAKSSGIRETIVAAAIVIGTIAGVVVAGPVIANIFKHRDGGNRAVENVDPPGGTAPSSVLQIKVVKEKHLPARDVLVKPPGRPAVVTDIFGECSLDGTCRGETLEFFSAAGELLARWQAPLAGMLIVDLSHHPDG